MLIQPTFVWWLCIRQKRWTKNFMLAPFKLLTVVPCTMMHCSCVPEAMFRYMVDEWIWPQKPNHISQPKWAVHTEPVWNQWSNPIWAQLYLRCGACTHDGWGAVGVRYLGGNRTYLNGPHLTIGRSDGQFTNTRHIKENTIKMKERLLRF